MATTFGFGFSLPATASAAVAAQNLTTGDLLMANGVNYILLENGDRIKIEYLPPPPP